MVLTSDCAYRVDTRWDGNLGEVLVILSRSNLLAYHATSKNSPVLNNLHVTEDGSTVAFDGAALLAVSPVLPERKEQLPLKDSGSTKDITVSTDTIKEVLKALPVDKKFDGSLEHCDLSAEGVFTHTDGPRDHTIKAKVYPRQYIDYKGLLGAAKASPVMARVVLNRDRMAALLALIDKICPDGTGEAPVFLEFTENNDIFMRAINPLNRQRVIAYMTSYKGEEGQWLEEDAWEQHMTKSPKLNGTSMPMASQVPPGKAGSGIDFAARLTKPSTSTSKPVAGTNYAASAVAHAIPPTSNPSQKKSAAHKIPNEWRK